MSSSLLYTLNNETLCGVSRVSLVGFSRFSRLFRHSRDITAAVYFEVLYFRPCLSNLPVESYRHVVSYLHCYHVSESGQNRVLMFVLFVSAACTRSMLYCSTSLYYVLTWYAAMENERKLVIELSTVGDDEA